MDFQLVVVRGKASSTTIKLNDGVTTVGRQDECQLRIKSSQVSRKHCEIFEKKGLLLVKDLGSSNGTFVNGKKIEGQRVLEAGDEIMIGQVSLKVAKVGAAPPPPAAKATAPAAAPAAAAGPKPGDTAVTGAKGAAATGPGSDDDFDLDFDADADMDGPSLEAGSDDATAVVPPPAAKAPAPPKAAAKPAQPAAAAPAPEPAGADDAVADFLLDIKFDDDE